MLKKIILLNIILLCSGACFSFSDDDLNRLEYEKYGQAYIFESLGDRLNRLETDIFGMAQNGNPEDRVNKLIKISQNAKNAVFNNPYYDEKPLKKSKLQNFRDSFTDLFGAGSITGFTPSIINSGYGYSDSIYRNEFNNFLNNPSGYCPYHNRYTNPIAGSYYNPAITTAGVYRPPMPPSMYNGRYPINNRYYHQSYYAPPNISTSSGVHIIND